MATGQAGAEIARDQSPSLTCNHEAPILAPGGRFVDGVSHSLRGEGHDASEDGTGRGVPLVPIAFSAKDHGADAAENISPTLRAGGFDKSHANSGNWMAVAFMENQRGEFRTSEQTDALTRGGGKPGQGYAAAAVGMSVRRLTPRECERLQGFPEIENEVTIFVWSTERQKIGVHAAISNLKSQKSALDAGAEKYLPYVKTAGQNSSISLAGNDLPVAVNVQIDLERGQVLLHNPKKSAWLALTADKQNLYLRLAQGQDFALLLALMPKIAEKITLNGRAELQQSIRHFSQGLNGKIYAAASGREIAELAFDAQHVTDVAKNCTKFITSEAGQSTQNLEQIWQTSLCCVSAVINSFIQNEIQPQSLYALNLKIKSPYTLVPDGKKMTADGPRYKMLGNSMAVPVMAWIGQRIQMVEDMT